MENVLDYIECSETLWTEEGIKHLYTVNAAYIHLVLEELINQGKDVQLYKHETGAIDILEVEPLPDKTMVDKYGVLALLFAENHGIISYWNFDNKMVWEEYFINEGRFLHILNLDTNEEEVIKTEKAEWEK